MYVLCFNGKTVTLADLERRERHSGAWQLEAAERRQLIAAPTPAGVRAIYVHYAGFTWRERAAGYTIETACFL